MQMRIVMLGALVVYCGYSPLLQAQDAIVAAHLSLVQARFDVAAADLALRYSAGTFPPK